MDWKNVPLVEENQYWLNHVPVQIEIPSCDYQSIADSLVYHVKMIDFLKVTSMFDSRLFNNLQKFFLSTICVVPFTLCPRLSFTRLPESCRPTFFLGKLMGYISVWLEFDNDDVKLPSFVRDSIDRALSIGVEFCQLEGHNFRRVQIEMHNDEERMNINSIDIEMSMDAFRALLEFMSTLSPAQFCDSESDKWLAASPSRVVLQRLGQDAAVKNSSGVQAYLDDLLRFLDRSLISEIQVAFATNIYSAPESGANYLGMKEESCRKLFTGVGPNMYTTFNLQSVARVQARSMPKSFVESLIVPEGVSIVACQVYSTSKALLRPTDYEEPFAQGELTKNLLNKSISPSVLTKKLAGSQNNLGKLRQFKNRIAGLRVEYEILIDFSKDDTLMDPSVLGQTIVHCFDTFCPFNEASVSLFGEPLDTLAIAVKSEHMFEYAARMLAHMLKPIENIYLKICQNKECITPDFLEIVAIMERLCRCFMSGNYRFISKPMRINRILENIREFGVPFFPSRLIDLQSLKISWPFWKDQDVNKFIVSFDYFANQAQKDLYDCQIRLLAYVRNLSDELRRTNASLMEYLPQLRKTVELVIISLILECRSEFLMKIGGKLSPDSKQDADIYNFLESQNPKLFFSSENKEVVERSSDIHFKNSIYNIEKFINEVMLSDENFNGYFFKILLQEVSCIWMLTGESRMEDEFLDQIVQSLYMKGITWFIHPMSRVSMTRVIHVQLDQSNNAEMHQIQGSTNGESADGVLPQRLPPLSQPIKLNECKDMKNALETAISRLRKKMRGAGENFDNCLNDACATLAPNSDARDLFALLAFWLCYKNQMIRSSPKIGNAGQAGALLLHYIILKGPSTTMKQMFLKQFGGDTGCAFQNYGAGKKFLKKIKFLITDRSTELNFQYLRSFSFERILEATKWPLDEQLKFFGLEGVLAT